MTSNSSMTPNSLQMSSINESGGVFLFRSTNEIYAIDLPVLFDISFKVMFFDLRIVFNIEKSIILISCEFL